MKKIVKNRPIFKRKIKDIYEKTAKSKVFCHIFQLKTTFYVSLALAIEVENIQDFHQKCLRFLSEIEPACPLTIGMEP